MVGCGEKNVDKFTCLLTCKVIGKCLLPGNPAFLLLTRKGSHLLPVNQGGCCEAYILKMRIEEV